MLHTDRIDGAADALYGPSHVIGWGRPSNTNNDRTIIGKEEKIEKIIPDAAAISDKIIFWFSNCGWNISSYETDLINWIIN
jgi:hypothetical protein